MNLMNGALNEVLLQSICVIAEKYAIRRIVLFGSRARGDHKPTSDIDLAVYPAVDFARQGCFFSEIDDLPTLLKIDLILINENTDGRLLENIKKEGVVIYEQSGAKIRKL